MGEAFTPGPWEVAPEGTYPRDEGCKVVGPYRVNSEGHPVRYYVAQFVMRENVHLIAAAPDLYEALRRAQEELRMINMKDTGAIYDVGLRTDISAALAKACPTPTVAATDNEGGER